MKPITQTKEIKTSRDFAGRTWLYDFRFLDKVFDEKTAQKRCNKLTEKFGTLTKNWNDEKNSEWICRHYLATKMIMSATLQINTLEFARQCNVRLPTSYLAYYSLLSLMRAVLFTSQSQDWRDGGLIASTHSNTRNVVCELIGSFDKKVGENLENYITKLKAWRELISYRSPASGDPFKIDIEELKYYATLLAEYAQMNSEIIENAARKNAPRVYEKIKESYFERIISVELDGNYFFDDTDWSNLGKISIQRPYVVNLLYLLEEGHVDDFFEPWTSPENDPEHAFNPDENWQIIFDIP